MEWLIDHSSLGSPGARRLRARTPPDLAQGILDAVYGRNITVKFTLTIESDSAAMADHPIETTIDALNQVIAKLKDRALEGRINDPGYGHKIGEFALTAESESDQDEAEDICGNVEELYDEARYGTAESLEEVVRAWSSRQEIETFDPDNVDYDKLIAFLRS